MLCYTFSQHPSKSGTHYFSHWMRGGWIRVLCCSPKEMQNAICKIIKLLCLLEKIWTLHAMTAEENILLKFRMNPSMFQQSWNARDKYNQKQCNNIMDTYNFAAIFTVPLYWNQLKWWVVRLFHRSWNNKN